LRKSIKVLKKGEIIQQFHLLLCLSPLTQKILAAISPPSIVIVQDEQIEISNKISKLILFQMIEQAKERFNGGVGRHRWYGVHRSLCG
jgi:hypothetical protein